MSSHQKITERHRQRRAVVDVRQSTMAQVESNTASAQRQYALRERAIDLGRPAASVVVVDEDTGRSGASTDGRVGFKELVAEVEPERESAPKGRREVRRGVEPAHDGRGRVGRRGRARLAVEDRDRVAEA
jgi:hypothetical protein